MNSKQLINLFKMFVSDINLNEKLEILDTLQCYFGLEPLENFTELNTLLELVNQWYMQNSIIGTLEQYTLALINTAVKTGKPFEYFTKIVESDGALLDSIKVLYK